MKQVRLLVAAGALLLSGVVFAQHGNVIALNRTIVSHPNHNVILNARAHASLAIDTYGYFDIRVWVDGVLINNSPRTYVEIPSLRSGYRLVDIEVFGPRGSYFVTHDMYLEPYRWNLFEVQRHPSHNWIAVSALYTKPMGYYYAGGRRSSVNIAINRPVWKRTYNVRPVHYNHRITRSHGHIQRQENGRQVQQNDNRGRSVSGRGGVHYQEGDREDRQPRGRGTRSSG